MDTPVEFAVVVPCQSFEYDPLNPFDEHYFDRTVDKILSEEASMEESRQEQDDVEEQSELKDDITSESTVQVTSESRIEESAALRSPPPATSAPSNEWAPDYEDQNIFASVGKEKRIEILVAISKMPFMLKHPLTTSERIKFTSDVFALANDAGIPQPYAESLVEFVRQTYFWEHEITPTESNATTFGDEINDLEEVPIQPVTDEAKDKQPASKKRRRSAASSPMISRRAETSPEVQPAFMSTPAGTAHQTPDMNSSGTRKLKKVACADCRRRKRRCCHNEYRPMDLINAKDDAIKPLDLPTPSVKRVRIQKDTPEKQDDANKPLHPLTPSVKRVQIQQDTPDEEFVDALEQPATPEQASISNLPEIINLMEDSTLGGPEKLADAVAPADNVVPDNMQTPADQDTKSQPSKRSKDELEEFKKAKNQRKRARRNEKKRRASMGLDKTGESVDQPAQNENSSTTVQKKSTKTRAKGSKERKLAFHSAKEIDLDSNKILLFTSFQGPRRVGCGFLKTSDLPGLTPSDEVKSKYFSKADQRDDVQPGRQHSPISPTPLIPELIDRAPERPERNADCPLPNLPPTPQTPRRRYPKLSPYFPVAQVDPESCLPFPPIDAPSFGLIQEQLAHDPFRLLIATIFLNRTRGGVALPVLFQVFERYPTIGAMATATQSDLVSMIRCLGFQNQRARKCITLAQTWLTDPPTPHKRYRRIHYPREYDGRNVGRDECIDAEDLRVAWEVAHLPGVGAYSLDSWRIFCRDELRGLATDWIGTGANESGFVPEWKCVLPQDKELRAYLTWMWLKEGWTWDHNTGDLTAASEQTMKAARSGGIAHEEDGNWVLETSPAKAMNGLHS
ncbi:unnamed protein product [Penicillium salamii]|nr:unnamed protein product [Penicillium salamii]CAG8382280.1 unnamed protein product [Penicillium salamii]